MLTVGCPVVVSTLPREWSCFYRREQWAKGFFLDVNYLFSNLGGSFQSRSSSIVSRYRATATSH